MKELFVPYELALLAKEKKFDEDCLAYYNTDPKLKRDRLVLSKSLNHKYCVPAPLYWQLIKWLYEVHNMFICMEPWDGDGKWRIMRNFGSEIVKESVTLYIYAEGEKLKEEWLGGYDDAIEEALKLISYY